MLRPAIRKTTATKIRAPDMVPSLPYPTRRNYLRLPGIRLARVLSTSGGKEMTKDKGAAKLAAPVRLGGG
jgi:hypothetical protein